MIDQPFFIEDRFYTDISDFLCSYDNEELFDEDDPEKLSKDIQEDWTQEIELTTLEPMFEVKPSDVDYMVDLLIENNEDRVGEDDNSEEIKKAILAGMDFDKINAAIPRLWYPNGQLVTITKQDLIDNI